MKILFIGGSGNISSVVTEKLIKKGHDVFLLNRGITSSEGVGAKLIQADINDYSGVKALTEKENWDIVVNWIAFTEKDVERDIQLFKGKTKQYIFISSASVYQKPPSTPFITESTPLCNPYWQYSRDKIACEERLIREYRSYDFPVTIVRPSHTYNTVIPVAIWGWKEYTIIDRIKKGKEIVVHGDGTSLWVLTHAEDFAKGFIGLAGLPQAIGHAFQITSDEVLSWNQIYNIIGNTIGYEPNIVHIPTDFIIKINPELTGNLMGDKAHSVIFDNSKIKSFVPGYTAIIPFSKGIKETIRWFEEDKDRMKINPEINNNFDKLIKAYKKG